MAQRFTHTEKYSLDWFLKLSRNGKLLYYYLTENCDHAGFYSIGLFHISMCIDLNDQEAGDALKELDNKIVWSDNKTMIWLKDFLEDQANIPLNKHNNAHKGAINKIEQHFPKFQKNIDMFYNLPCEHKPKDGTGKKELLGEFLLINPKDGTTPDAKNNPDPTGTQP